MRLLAGWMLAVAGCAPSMVQDGTREYRISGEHVEGCECRSVCPCVFEQDATGDECRAILAYRISEGSYGDVDLDGLVFAFSSTQMGKNIGKSAGRWEGVLYLPSSAREEQRRGLSEIFKREMGSLFAKLEEKVVDLKLTGEDGAYELTIGDVGRLKTRPILGANGKPTLVKNPPSPLALEKNYCAIAEVHTYDDAGNRWDFAGRNAFYGPFTMESKEKP
jgi:hypothetical protein